jgi:two-component system, NarL family, invasion response regulator UvrY
MADSAKNFVFIVAYASRTARGVKHSLDPVVEDWYKQPAMTSPARRKDVNHPDGPGAWRVLIADDHEMIRQGLRQLLTRAFPKAGFGEADTGDEALDQVRRQTWDIVLLDLTMPGRNGMDVLKRIVEAQPKTRVLVLSMHPEDQYALRVLKSGAAGYLTKHTDSGEILHAVRKVLAGQRYVSPALAETLAASLKARSGTPGHLLVSEQEQHVMRLIAAGRSIKEIAYELGVSVKTVSTRRVRLMEKLKLKTNADLIRYAVRQRQVD